MKQWEHQTRIPACIRRGCTLIRMSPDNVTYMACQISYRAASYQQASTSLSHQSGNRTVYTLRSPEAPAFLKLASTVRFRHAVHLRVELRSGLDPLPVSNGSRHGNTHFHSATLMLIAISRFGRKASRTNVRGVMEEFPELRDHTHDHIETLEFC